MQWSSSSVVARKDIHYSIDLYTSSYLHFVFQLQPLLHLSVSYFWLLSNPPLLLRFPTLLSSSSSQSLVWFDRNAYCTVHREQLSCIKINYRICWNWTELNSQDRVLTARQRFAQLCYILLKSIIHNFKYYRIAFLNHKYVFFFTHFFARCELDTFFLLTWSAKEIFTQGFVWKTHAPPV